MFKRNRVEVVAIVGTRLRLDGRNMSPCGLPSCRTSGEDNRWSTGKRIAPNAGTPWKSSRRLAGSICRAVVQPTPNEAFV